MIEILRKLDRIHPYPAKYTVDLAIEYIEKYSSEGQVVYDPFVGSGTTVLGATYLNRIGLGTDINFIAILISQFKILNLKDTDLETIESFYNFISSKTPDDIILEGISRQDFQNIDHWFQEDMIIFLSYLKANIETFSNNNENIKTFLNLVFSSVITTLSNQESDTRYAAKKKERLNTQYAIDVYSKKLLASIEIFRELKLNKDFLNKANVFLKDSKKVTEVIDEDTVDLIMTSPPYPNTYDYYLYHKHRMNWLDFDVKYSMTKEIGSRREFSSLKRPIENFNNDMFEILTEANKVLKKGGIVILVMGDGKVQGEKYDAKENMLLIGERIGWDLIDYSYTMLDDTSRSFQQSYRTKGKKEHIICFRKV